MNIFAYDPDPKLCALWLDDVRKNKMITETAQLLSTCMRYRKPAWSLDRKDIMASAYVNHPCSLWVRESWANFRWLTEHMQALCNQWGRPHKSARVIAPALKAGINFGLDDQLTPFANCARNQSLGINFKTVEDTHLAYRMYTRERWKQDTIRLSWVYGEEPEWRYE